MMSKIPALSAFNLVDGFEHSSEDLQITAESNAAISETLKKLNFIGDSVAFRKTVENISKFSCSKAPIFLEGETGSGKELAARALHYLGPRKSKPFIPVNCGAFPESMFENELFGHSKGAYTDATAVQTGLIEQANGGTLFLDEVDSLPAKSQVSLLRFLQDQQYRPLGSCKMVQSNITVISATNVDLASKVAEGLFREDLLFRINVINIHIPALRERTEDILLLADYFLSSFEQTYQQGKKGLSQNAIDWLLNYRWPGNIRELQNWLHKEYLLADGSSINFGNQANNQQNAPKPLVNLQESCIKSPFSELRSKVLREFEYQYLHTLMQKTCGNISMAARMVDKERRSLGRLLEKHGIDKNTYLSH
jgi:DNA-binding NtrC family response regulator